MNKETKVLADIQEDADKLFPYERILVTSLGKESNISGDKRKAYIQGRLEERAKTANAAIEFAYWLLENNWQNTSISWYKRHSTKSGIANTRENCYKTTHQLYELWLQTKTQ